MKGKNTGLLNLKEEKKQILTNIECLNSILSADFGINIEIKYSQSENYLEITGRQANGKYVSKYSILDTLYKNIKPILPESYRLIIKLDSF